MARYQNPFAVGERYPTDPAWAQLGGNLATALFGDPEMRAQAALRKAQTDEALATAAYNTSRTAGQDIQNRGALRIEGNPLSTAITRPPVATPAAPVMPTLPSVNYGAAAAPSAAPATAARPYNSAALSSLVRTIAPNAVITSGARDPNSALGRANPKSFHNVGRAIDMAAVPGMTFDQMRERLVSQGVPLAEAIDEYKHPSPHATGGHWHFATGQGNAPAAVAPRGAPAPASVSAPVLAPEDAGATVDTPAVQELVRNMILSGRGNEVQGVIGALLGAAGGDQVMRRALVVQGKQPTDDLAADRSAALNNMAINQYGDLAKAVATGNISQGGENYREGVQSGDRRYGADQNLAGDKYRADRAYAADVYKADHSGTGGGAGGKPASAGIQKILDDHLGTIGATAGVNADIGALSNMINQGKLRLGPYENQLSEGANWLGASTDNSKNYATFKGTIEKIRNQTLLLNKGVQTEGDAQRALNELFSNLNDAGVVRQRLSEIGAINQRAINLRKAQVDQLRSDNHMPAMDYSRLNTGGAAIAGANNRPPLSSFQR